MSRLIMWNLVTLDGCFEGPKSWDLGFHQKVWGEELERMSIGQLHGADALLFGRATWEGMAAYWKTETGEVAELMNSLPKFVFSRTLRSADWTNSTLVRDDAVAATLKLKREGARDLFVFGSATLSETFIEAGLFDEYRLILVPVLLGEGGPLFRRGKAPHELKLLESRALVSGGVLLRYAPA